MRYHRHQSDDSVSPVIGVILMIAITVILSGIVLVGLGGLASQETPASAGAEIEDTSEITTQIRIIDSGTSESLYVTSTLGTRYDISGTGDEISVLSVNNQDDINVIGSTDGTETVVQTQKPSSGFSADITVDANGTEDYTTIQAAVDNASTGDIIVVEKAVYEENVTVDKEVKIFAEQGVVVQDKNPEKGVFMVRADNVTIANFVIDADPYPDSVDIDETGIAHYAEHGIHTTAKSGTFYNNTILNAGHESQSSGIQLDTGSENTTVVGNDFSDSGNNTGVSVKDNPETQSITRNNFDGVSGTTVDNQTTTGIVTAENNDYGSDKPYETTSGKVDSSGSTDTSYTGGSLSASFQTASSEEQQLESGGQVTSTSNSAPVVSVSASSTETKLGSEISVDASETFDPDYDNVTYTWDFGDGTTKTGTTVTHTYDSSGIYTITVTATDSEGDSDQASIEVSVGATTVSDFKLTKNEYKAQESPIKNACGDEFGSNYRIARWGNIADMRTTIDNPDWTKFDEEFLSNGTVFISKGGDTTEYSFYGDEKVYYLDNSYPSDWDDYGEFATDSGKTYTVGASYDGYRRVLCEKVE